MRSALVLAAFAAVGCAKPCKPVSSRPVDLSSITSPSSIASSTASLRHSESSSAGPSIPTTTSPAGDVCFQALELEGSAARSDCSQALVYVSTATETVIKSTTITIVESAVVTEAVTELKTTTGTTETSLFTTTLTSTEFVTEPVTTTQITIVATTTDTTTTTPTTTSFTFAPPALKLRDDQPATGQIPPYASEACSDFSQYASACGQLGVSTTTSTSTITVTETGPIITTSATTTWNTETSTSLDISSATATISTTQTETKPTTTTTTTTTTATLSSTETAVATISADPIIITKRCLVSQRGFRLRIVSATDGQTRYLYFSERWQATSPIYGTWSTDGNPVRGGVGFRLPPDIAPIGMLSTTGGGGYYSDIATFGVTPGAPTPDSVPIRITTRDPAAAMVRAGTARYVPSCIDAQTGAFEMQGEGGKTNILDCEGTFYLSSGDGSDTGLSCTRVVPDVYYY